MNTSRKTYTIIQRQHGAAFIVMLVFLIMGVAAFLVSSLNSSAVQIQRDKFNADVLAQAKDALIGYAASADLNTNPSAASPRPGNLPCPDSNNDGTADSPCNGNALGRLPWKTLGLPDLRDSSGERLWYAVSSVFKKSSPYTCCLNSDTPGKISVFASNGSLLNDGSSTGSGSTGAAAIIIAPGDVLTRQGGTLQDRNSAGVNTASNYLDIATIGGNTIDNANFIDGSSTNGFIQGRIKDNNGNLIVNDQLLIITQDNIMQAVQKRVAGEVKQCLSDYAAPANGGIGLYPWATRVSDLTYQDNSGTLFGRIPDTSFGDTQGDNGGMQDHWVGSNCNIISNSGWWLNWKELVFYGLSDAYSPDHNTGALLLTVTPTSTSSKFVVIVAGKQLAGQNRTSPNNKNLSNYLDSPNPTTNPPPYPTTFSQNAPSSTFNDTVVFQ